MLKFRFDRRISRRGPNIGLAGCRISLFSLPGCGMKENLKVRKVRNGREVGSLSFSWREAEIIDFSGWEIGIDDDNALEYLTNP